MIIFVCVNDAMIDAFTSRTCPEKDAINRIIGMDAKPSQMLLCRSCTDVRMCDDMMGSVRKGGRFASPYRPACQSARIGSAIAPNTPVIVPRGSRTNALNSAAYLRRVTSSPTISPPRSTASCFQRYRIVGRPCALCAITLALRRPGMRFVAVCIADIFYPCASLEAVRRCDIRASDDLCPSCRQPDASVGRITQYAGLRKMADVTNM